MNLKLTHTEGDVEFVRAEDVEIGADSSRGQMAYSVALKLPEGWVDYIRAVRSVERVPDTPFHYNHATGCQSEPTPLGDRIRKSLAERMSQHYSEQLPPTKDRWTPEGWQSVDTSVELPPYEELQLKVVGLEQRVAELEKQLADEVNEHHLTAITAHLKWDEADTLANRVEMATRWLTGQEGGGK